jgi:hypothetical protein
LDIEEAGMKWGVDGDELGVVAADEAADELRDGMECSRGSEVVLDWRRRRKGKEREGRR